MSLTKEDREILDKLVNFDTTVAMDSDELTAYKKILDVSGRWKVQYPLSTEESFERLSQSTQLKKNIGNEGHWYYGVAAAFVILFMSWFVLLDLNTVQFSSKVAEIKSVYLPDSSEVILNASSQISFNSKEWEQGIRYVEMKGHAHFKVRKGSEFTVESDHGQVQVLGTSFDVFDRENDYKVECYTGKVAVSSFDSRVLLTKGLKTSLNSTVSQLRRPSSFVIKLNQQWLSGTFNYSGTPVVDVFSEIERQFGVSINSEQPLTNVYTGSFSNEDLVVALDNVCKPLGLFYQFESRNSIKIINQTVI